ncbi:MAG: GMC family oxidoreductase N-terminal domain-containing protein, partial [Pseudomonadota bacterium]
IFIRMPAGVAKAIKSPRWNWHYWTTPQVHMNNRRLTTPRGKTLGGSSAINALVYIRGNAWDFDNWAALGCDGWGYQDVLPYFCEVEGNAHGNGAFHGGDGPLKVSHPESGNPAYQAFINAGVELGHRFNSDLNGAEQEGFGLFQLNINDGRRWSSADAFLKPALDRKNLSVKTNAHVVGLATEGARVTGVRLADETLHAAHVVLSAGSIGSPQTLMLSGIGPADHLKSLGITPIVDLPQLGENLQDHLEVKVKHRMTQPYSMWSHAKFPNYLWTGLNYLLRKEGAGRQQGLEAGAFCTLDPQAPAPDTQLHFVNALAFDGATPDDRGHGYAIDVTQTRPESRGTLRLASANPKDAPLIDPNYLAEEKDRTQLRAGMKLLRDLCRQPSLADISEPEMLPGPDVQTDTDLDAYIRNTAESIYHPVGTARMGRDDDAPVDSATMAVRGVDNLYLADASVMPQLVSGNTNATSIMIGTKGADLIQAALEA